jgi:hypothetical protein
MHKQSHRLYRHDVYSCSDTNKQSLNTGSPELLHEDVS